MKKKLKSIWFRLKGKHICEHGDCLNEAMQVHLVAYSDDYKRNWDEYYWYCTEHCQTEGFCWYCGEFWAGCEAFDFNPSGLCPNCKDSAAEDLGEYECEDEYEDNFYEMEPL